jgi:photosystem II stability/assembly factor-like uncharacterized protein
VSAEVELALGTDRGVVVLEGPPWVEQRTGLDRHEVRSLCYAGGRQAHVLLAGTYGRGVWRSLDYGETWTRATGLPDTCYVRALFSLPQAVGTVLAGTEPAGVYRSSDCGATWAEIDQIRRLPGASQWFLPYSPRAGAVRGFAADPREPQRLYAALEVGGILRSICGGDEWQLIDAEVHPDVHSVAISPDGTTLLAATGGGVYRSTDGGAAWDQVADAYTRAVSFHPQSPEIAVAGPAHHIGSEGRIIASHDGGQSWLLAARGVEIPMPDMVEHFCVGAGARPLTDLLVAVTSDGRLLYSQLDPVAWQTLAVRTPPVRCCALRP